MKEYGADTSSITVDNAAKQVATKVCKMLEKEYLHLKIVVSCDSSHCVDLVIKGLAQMNVMQRAIIDCKRIQDLMKIDRIDSIYHETAACEELIFHSTAFNIVDTHMNLLHDVVVSARKCHDFLMLLSGNPKYREYCNGRCTEKECKSLDALLASFRDEHLWRMFDLAIEFTHPFKDAHLLCSCRDVPLSVHPILIQGL
eukprot:10671440-Ditylum_brightwellii.AAC.1